MVDSIFNAAQDRPQDTLNMESTISYPEMSNPAVPGPVPSSREASCSRPR
jgi:hypothetical protein